MDIARIYDHADDAAELLTVLANPNRLMVLCNLLSGEMAVLPLAESVGMTQSALSQQLAKLRALKLVETRRDGRTIYYRLASDKVERLLAALYDIYCVVPAVAVSPQRPEVAATAAARSATAT